MPSVPTDTIHLSDFQSAVFFFFLQAIAHADAIPVCIHNTFALSMQLFSSSESGKKLKNFLPCLELLM